MFSGLIGFLVVGTVMSFSTNEEAFKRMRDQMVEIQIAGRDVGNSDILRAMRIVPRHLFVPESEREQAYGDHPLPIGQGQTISQPYIVAKMTELGDVKKGSKVLEVGSGSGYQAAVLAEMGAEVYTIEILPELSKQAEKNLQSAGYKKVQVRAGDGYRGWPEAAPFDSILVTAAPEEVPQPLIDQLKVGGKLVIPVGPSASLFSHQQLLVITKTKDGSERRSVFPVAFVPMTGETQTKKAKNR